jgi:transposase
MPKRLALRRLRRGEKQRLRRKSHDRKLPIWMAQRYRVIALVYAGLSVRAAARRLMCAKETAYTWLRVFNGSGFRQFERISNPQGRPSTVSRSQLQTLIQLAQKRPTDVGLPFTNWSMTKLRDYLVKHRRFPAMSAEWLRRLLRRAGISWQRTKTWKRSMDPEFEAKKSAFWRSTPNVRNALWSSATINSDPWNCVRSPVGVGPAVASPNAYEPPIRASRASSNCMGSTMSMPIVWSDEYASARPHRTLWPALRACAAAIRCHCASTSCWIISRRTGVRLMITFPVITWKPCTCPPMPHG